MNLDWDRDLIIRKHRKAQIQVVMYKDRPGYYFTTSGVSVGQKVAREAGFDVKGDTHRRKYQAKVVEAMKAINSEFDDIEGMIVHEAGNYKVVCRGGDPAIYQIVDLEEVPLSPKFMSRAEAIQLVETIVGADNGKTQT